MELFVARHPIFNESQNLYGYELIFRAGVEDYCSAAGEDEDEDEALADEDQAVDFVKFAELTDGKRGFVHFTRNLLRDEISPVLPKDMVIVGVPENITPDEEVVSTCRTLKKSGYTLAMDDLFVLQHRYTEITQFADIIRVDFHRAGAEERKVICEEFGAAQVTMLAQNVETAEEFDQALEMGYSRFHGDFFAKPIHHPGKPISGTKLAYLEVLREVNSPAISYDELESYVRKDVSMTHKLLRFINSTWFGLRHQVDSIKHALVLLGPKEIKKWFSLLIIRHAGMDKPDELLLRSLYRAKLAEDIAPLARLGGESGELFLMGMFSLIDALTDTPMMDVLDGLALNNRIKAALLGESGRFRSVLETILSYEKGEWEWFAASAASLAFDEAAFPDLYRKAVTWANLALREV